MKHPNRSLFLFIVLVAGVLHAQVVPFEKYTSKNGLVSDRITAITQDEKGFMWFGSYFGICRYDGIKFQKTELHPKQQNNYVTFLSPAGGKIYAGFLFGGGLMEYRNGKATAHFIGGKDSAIANEFVCMHDNMDGSILLCNTSNQIYQFKNGRFTHIHSLQQKKASFPANILKDRYNNIWVGTDQGLFVLPYPYTSAQCYFPGETIFSLVKDVSQKLWFSRTNGKNTVTQTTEGWQNKNFVALYTVAQSSTVRRVPFSGSLSKGFWLVDTDRGLVNMNNRQIASYKIPLDPGTDINTLYADREGNVWIANEPGVFKVSNFNTQSFLFGEIAAGGGSVSLEGDSVVWVSNSKALYKVANGTIQKEFLRQPPPDYFGALFIDRRKNLWFGLWNEGIWKTQQEAGRLKKKTYFSEFHGKKIKAQAVLEDSRGNMWVGGLNGIFRIKENKVVDHFHPLNASGDPAFISCMALDEKNNTLWLGDNAQGIVKLRYQLGPGKAITYHVAGYITVKQGLKDNYIRSILADHKKNIWVGTRNGGIFQIKETGKGLTVTDCNKVAGLSCARVTSIAVQDTTAVWFAACDGLYRYHYSTNRWHHYTTSDGLLNAEVFHTQVDAKNGFVWALTAQGVTRLKIDLKEKAEPPPLINITAVAVLGKPDTNALQNASRTKYPYTKNSIGFSYAAGSFIDERKTRYKYMLEEFDKEWSDEVVTTHVNYASLPPGKYAFKVMAANAKGQWSAVPASFEFEIVRPFYKSLWFIFFLTTLGIFILYLIRTQQLKQRYRIEKLRLSIARDLHDDVGSTLGSINLLSKTASRRLDNNPNPEEIKPIFHKIGQSAETTLEAMDDIVWSINPGKDKIHDLVIRMREFAIPLLEAKGVEFGFEVEGNQDQSIPMNLRRNIFLIYKEAIHNILKHSEATQVHICLETAQGRLLLHVRDNGKGFALQASSNRNGLQNLYGRAKAVGGTMKIRSCTSGTSVSFSAPIR